MTPYLEAAVRAGIWLQAQALSVAKGVAWAEAGGVPSPTYYHGTAGVVVFMVELFRATNDERWLSLAEQGAQYLVDALETEPGYDFPRGLAGIGFALGQVADAADRRDFAEAVPRTFERLRKGVLYEHGAHWGGRNDVSSGSAGIGLYLLWLARRLSSREPLAMAIDAGARLVDLAQPVANGVRWDAGAWRPVVLPTDPNKPFFMPNFSHGTAGVAYFLASLALTGGDGSFATTAAAAGRYLQAIAEVRPDRTWRIFNHEPGGEDLFYLGFCHGPVGTGRLFYQLAKLQPQGNWGEWFVNGARSVLHCTDPIEREAGLWTNRGICCGTAGVGAFAIETYGVTHLQELRELAASIADELIAEGTRVGEGFAWVNTEHRLRPEERRIQPGFMQGVAGIGSFLLEWHGVLVGAGVTIRNPDNPFPPMVS